MTKGSALTRTSVPPAALAFIGAVAVVAAPSPALAAPHVWAIDDGEKIGRDDVATPLATGASNTVWSPGQPIRLFAMRNETVAFQIVVAADDVPLEHVTVDLDELVLPSDTAAIRNLPGATDPTLYTGRWIERFVEHFVTVPRASGGKDPRESIGWAAGSAPTPGKWIGEWPDALVPVEVAPPWAPYPMRIAPRTNGVVWIDVAVPRAEPPGVHRGTVVVRAGGHELASLPVELDVIDAALPDAPPRPIVYYERRSVARRIGEADADAAEAHLFRVLHRHRMAPLHGATTLAEVERVAPALDGSLYTAGRGYQGPGEGLGDGVLSLGTYGAFGDPDASKLAEVERLAGALAARGLLESTDVFVYAEDEDCKSPRGAAWKRLLAGSKDPNVRRVRVAWTCSEDAASQPVDVVMQLATYDPARAAAARARGKDVWIYNGHQPQTATFFLDAPAVATRVNGWIASTFEVPRWFYWESTYWYDEGRGGKGPHDPFVTAETFHNADGDWAMGDGLLVYPGKQVDVFVSHSIGMSGVVASIRLKNWRRGIEDGGYLALARAVDRARADAVAKELLGVVLADAKDGRRPSWSERGAPFFRARRELRAILEGRPAAASSSATSTSSPSPLGGAPAASPAPRPRAIAFAVAVAIAVAAVATAGLRAVRRRR